MPRQRKRRESDGESTTSSEDFVPKNAVKPSVSPAIEKAPTRARRAIKYTESAYNDDESIDDSSGERDNNVNNNHSNQASSEDSEEEEDKGPQIDLFLARRDIKEQNLDAKVGPFEYLIKWKGLSYLHVTWQTEDDVASFGWRIKSRLARFISKWESRVKKSTESSSEDEDAEGQEVKEEENDLFDPSYLVVERILATKPFPSFPKPIEALIPESSDELKHAYELYNLPPQSQLAEQESLAKPRKIQRQQLMEQKSALEIAQQHFVEEFKNRVAPLSMRMDLLNQELRNCLGDVARFHQLQSQLQSTAEAKQLIEVDSTPKYQAMVNAHHQVCAGCFFERDFFFALTHLVPYSGRVFLSRL